MFEAMYEWMDEMIAWMMDVRLMRWMRDETCVFG